MGKTLAILLTVFNRREATLKCLRDLYRQDAHKENIQIDFYLTDDGCSDGTPEAVRKEFPAVHIVGGDGTLFWNRGMIAAWGEAEKKDYDYYLWLNDDTFINYDAISRLLSTSCMHNDQSIIVGTTCAVGNKKLLTYGGRIKGKLVTDITRSVKCESMNGNIVLVPRSVFLVLGKLDCHYRHALGDYDYGLTATRSGIDIYTAVGILGECNTHDRPTVWMDPSQPFSKRWKNFYSPTGNNPYEMFYFRRKNFGLWPACVTFVTMYVHFLLPWLWRKSYKK